MATNSAKVEIKQGTVLGVGYTMERFGGEFRFGVRKSLTINTSRINCGNKGEEGQIGDQAKTLDDLIATEDYINLTINGHEFTGERFKLTGFSMPEGNWVELTEGTLTFEALEEGNMTQLLGGAIPDYSPSVANADYAGWGDSEPWKFLEDFSDTFSFSRSGNSISYQHTVNIKFSSLIKGTGNKLTPALSQGLQLASALIEGNEDQRPAFSWLIDSSTTQEGMTVQGLQNLYSDIGNPAYRRFITESVDEITNTVSVTESFSAENITGESTEQYSFAAQQRVNINEKGIINVTEDGSVQGLAVRPGYPSLRVAANDFVEIEKANAVNSLVDGGRLQKLFEAYKDNLKSGDGANQCDDGIPDLVVKEDGTLVLLENGVTYDEFKGSATYTVTGTNDQKLGENSSHEYTRTIEALSAQGWQTSPEDGIQSAYYKIAQQGVFRGVSSKKTILKPGEKAEKPRYNEALEAWRENCSIIKGELTGGAPPPPPGGIGLDDDAQPVNLSTTYNPFKGEVQYAMDYSTEPKYGIIRGGNQTSYKLRTYNYSDSWTTGIDDETCLRQYSIHNVVNHPDGVQVVQKRDTTAAPSSSESQRLVGRRDSKLEALLTTVKDSVGTNLTMKNGPKALKDCSYTFNNHNDKVLDINFSWE